HANELSESRERFKQILNRIESEEISPDEISSDEISLDKICDKIYSAKTYI
ncbi:2702_t:CDS:1, partial [Racocetra fulgida]